MNTYCADNVNCCYICRLRIVVVLLAFMLSAYSASAYQIPKNTSSDSTGINVTQEQVDPLGRSNPKGTVNGFFKSLAKEDYLRASKYIDFSVKSEINTDSTIESIVQKLQIVLDRYGRILPMNIISSDPEGDTNDGLDLSLEKVGSVYLNNKTIPVYLKQSSQNNQMVWLFASTTVDTLVSEIYDNNEVYEEALASDGLFSRRWKGAALSDWLINIFSAIGAYLIAWLFTIGIRWLVQLLWTDYKKSKYKNMVRALIVPLRLVLAVVILLNFSRAIGVSIIVRQAFGVVNLIAMWLALFIFVWLLIDAITSFGEEKLREKNQFGGLSAVSFFRNTAKFVLVVTALLIVLSTIGVNVTAGIAALGVGGIALALGAQRTIENVIGGLSVVFDQPVSVGDFCKFGTTLGTVEKIGMFSTRIRTLSRTIVTIPNADFSTQLIENYAKRDLFLYHTTLGLRYETTSDQMRYILVELRKILYAHPKVDPDPARVRFLGYGSDSLKVELFAYCYASDWSEFLGIQEDINLRLAKVIEESGSGFAFPSQTLYLAKDKGLSQDKKAEAEKRVREWIENDELRIPDFDPDTIASLKGSLKYPTKGSDASGTDEKAS